MGECGSYSTEREWSQRSHGTELGAGAGGHTQTRTDTAMIPPGTAELLSPGQVKGSRVLWCMLNVEEEIFFQEEGKKIK